MCVRVSVCETERETERERETVCLFVCCCHFGLLFVLLPLTF